MKSSNCGVDGLLCTPPPFLAALAGRARPLQRQAARGGLAVQALLAEETWTDLSVHRCHATNHFRHGLASVASKEAQNTAGIVFHLKRFVLVSHDRVLVISKVFMSVPVEHSGLFFTEIS
jgi:hypothetical protein